jgi:undecaprenyl-diphosphatase
MAKSAPVFIFSDRYQVSSELAFYMDSHPATYCINLGRRMNQYDLWPGFENFIGHHAIFVRKDIQDLPETVKNAFDNCDQNIVTLENRQKKTMKFTIFKCYNFNGMKMKQTESF